MLPSERTLAEKNGVLFEQYRQEALQRASAIVTSRESVRDVEMPIWAKVAFGLRGYVVFIYQKASRLVANVEAQDKLCVRKDVTSAEKIKALEVTIDEELLDIINYCSFAWAYRHLQQAETPICLKDTWMGDHPELASCLCPKCQAERVVQQSQEASNEAIRKAHQAACRNLRLIQIAIGNALGCLQAGNYEAAYKILHPFIAGRQAFPEEEP